MAKNNLARKSDTPAPRRNPAATPHVPELDRLIHERIRLAIVSALAANDSLTFTELKRLLELTDGNLSRHLTTLQEAGLVEIWKGYRGKKPQTLCRLTDDGRRRFLDYVNVLEAVLADAVEAARGGKKGRRALPEGFSPA